MAIRVLNVTGEKELIRLLAGMKVDPYGIRIMAPKAENFLIRLEGISYIAANILKQEMLSCGADVALPRDVLTGKTKRTDCVLILTLAQFARVKEKLSFQQFGLNRLAEEIARALENYRRAGFKLNLGKYKFDLGQRTLVMGILNLTPDSFSGDGLYGKDISEIVDLASEMVKDGADILDLGGESSRPGAKPVTLKEELKRTIPAIKEIARKIPVPISIDTCKPEVARAALDNGAALVNDISGLRDRSMALVCAKYKAGIVIMHMRGKPRTMQINPAYASVAGEIIDYLNNAVESALDSGIAREKIIVDPGIGFGKTLEHNLEILKDLNEFKVLGLPVLVGTSRKGFIGRILNADPEQRIAGTIATCVLASAKGANILRVHDVKPVAQALKISRAVLSRRIDYD